MTAPDARFLYLPWKYDYQGGRDLRLDFLRGYAMLVMVVDHLFLNLSAFYVITLQGKFYTTAAQGFFLISGYVLGILMARQTFTQAARRLLRRAGELYLAALALGLSFAALGWSTSLKLWSDLHETLPQGASAVPFIFNLLTLHNGFHGSEILVTYVVLLLLGILTIWLCSRGLGWLALLLSFGGYVLGQLIPMNLPVPMYFYPPTYQLIFTGGLVLGYHRVSLVTWAQRHQRMMLVFNSVMLATFVVLCGLYAMQYRLWPALPDLLGEAHRMPPLRLLFAAICLYSSYWLVTRLWKPLSALFGWFLVPIGQDSLWSFLVHYAVIVLLLINLPGFDLFAPLWQGTLLHGLLIGLVWLSVKLRQAIPVTHWRTAVTLGLILVAVPTPRVARYLWPYQYLDDRNSTWTWRNWTSYTDSNAYGGSHHAANAPGASARINFTGVEATLFGWTGQNAGQIEVTLDGLAQGVYDLRSDSAGRFRYPVFTLTGLPAGTHRLRIDVVGEGTTVIDYLRVKSR